MWFGEVDIPAEVIKAARAGELVLFVGAGASMSAPASLPSFGELVKGIIARTRTAVDERDAGHFDRILGRIRDDGVDVHSLVARAIDLPGSAPNRLHGAIIDVARSHPPLRIVTTNYDRHLTCAAHEACLQPEVFRGPALPVGDDFEGLVHLHGALGQEVRHLIVTDRDFGRAYLRDAWAARFAERMFAKYVVAFIGYSHGDVVLSYLARALTSEGTRFIFTAEPDNQNWKSLGLTPIHYPLAEDTHDALPEALERWARTTTMGLLGHQRQVARLVEAGPPNIPEDISYLEECLADPQRVAYFVEAARGAEWLAWVADRPQLSQLFVQNEANVEDRQVTGILGAWVADFFVMVKEESAAALLLMRDRPWTAQTLSLITHRLTYRPFALRDGLPDWLAPWLLLVLQRSPAGRNDRLDMLLTHESWRDRMDLVTVLLEHRTRPVLVPRLGPTDDAASFDVQLSGEEGCLTQAWTDVFKPSLHGHAHDLLDLAVRQLRSTYRLRRSTYVGSSWDPFTFGRSAIEEHSQDRFRDSMDVLIDAARDCLEHLLDTDLSAAISRLDEWAHAEEALLRRLAIHGLRLRTDLGPDARIQHVWDPRELYDLDTRHEVFALLGQEIPHADDELVATLLERVVAGPPEVEGDDRSTAYRCYNLLVWLARHAPGSVLIAKALESEQAARPDFGPREHPDLNVTVTSGVVEDGEPFTADELHSRFAADPSGTLDAIRHYQHQDDSFQLSGPTWGGALRAARLWVQRYPADGLNAASRLNGGDAELREAFIHAWSEAQLTDEQVNEVIDTISNWHPDQIRHSAARMLAFGGNGTRVTAWHRYPHARALATTLWPDTPIREDDGDLRLEALNHPAGNLAQFWTQAISHDWNQDTDNWDRIPESIRVQLDRIVNSPDRNGLLGRGMLARWLRFYYGADADWTSAHLFPLFDWTTHPAQASDIWQTFLDYGQFDDRLLEAGLLDQYVAACTHTEALGQRATDRLAAHLAAVAVRSAIDPGRWLTDFVKKAPNELREHWASHVAHLLHDLSPEEAAQQWERWIGNYWTERVDSVPRPLTTPEAAQMARWVIGLPSYRAEAIELTCKTPTALTEDAQLLQELLEEDLTQDPGSWTELLTHCLTHTRQAPWAVGHYLPDIVRKLKGVEPELDLEPLIEQAMRLGCHDAATW